MRNIVDERDILKQEFFIQDFERTNAVSVITYEYGTFLIWRNQFGKIEHFLLCGFDSKKVEVA